MLISAAAPAEKVLVFMNPAVTVKENYEFRRIYRKGKSAVSPQLVIYCQRAVETGYQKLESTYLRLLRQLNLLREDPS